MWDVPITRMEGTSLCGPSRHARSGLLKVWFEDGGSISTTRRATCSELRDALDYRAEVLECDQVGGLRHDSISMGAVHHPLHESINKSKERVCL